jgi:hypothetical protein
MIMHEKLFENNKLNLHFLQIDKEFKKLKRKNSLTNHNTCETVFINLNSLRSNNSNINNTSMSKSSNNNISLSHSINNKIHQLALSYDQQHSAESENNNKPYKIEHSLSPKSKFIRVTIEVSFEKLQQNLNGHLLTLNMKNLRVYPLMEINHIKAKLSYLKIELVNSDKENDQQVSAIDSPQMSPAKPFSATFVKLNRFKEKKCKFDRNLKNFAKQIDFELSTDHFITFTEEATKAQMRKLNQKNNNRSYFENGANNLNNGHGSDQKQDQQSKKSAYLFLFSIELHSYLPISRKTLSSTFRKQKRVFKGECQIHENFITFTEFPKTFILTEV